MIGAKPRQGAKMSRSKRKNHCGCWMCKPWKHGLEPKYKPSERRRLQKEPSDEQAYEDHQLYCDIKEGLISAHIDELIPTGSDRDDMF